MADLTFRFGELHPQVSKAFGLEHTTVLAAEFDLDMLMGKKGEAAP